ncbi:hypothetical protein SMC26_29595 [Actinomadura fulvescens]|uniref:Uncharacterized protein n=1 Tax=Actinomadura fulvescens TaxID=46160 RepID=A0ABP6CZV2_9ACTN
MTRRITHLGGAAALGLFLSLALLLILAWCPKDTGPRHGVTISGAQGISLRAFDQVHEDEWQHEEPSDPLTIRVRGLAPEARAVQAPDGLAAGTDPAAGQAIAFPLRLERHLHRVTRQVTCHLHAMLQVFRC